MFDFETKLGDIRFSQSIINKIVMRAVADSDGKALLHNFKGKYMNVVPGIASKINLYDEEAGSIEVVQTEGGLAIKVYVVLRFGTSIKSITGEIIDHIYEYAGRILEQKPSKVTVVVTGILSKNIARRHIEVSK